MATKGEVAIWLDDNAARLMVGAAPAAEEAEASRWVVKGLRVADESGVGLWLQADTIQELRRLPGKKAVKQVNWMFKSRELFIPWSAVLTIQAFEGAAKEIGFKAIPAE